jgi:hypothetical protein
MGFNSGFKGLIDLSILSTLQNSVSSSFHVRNIQNCSRLFYGFQVQIFSRSICVQTHTVHVIPSNKVSRFMFCITTVPLKCIKRAYHTGDVTV